jgi:hypothetical protein
VSVGFELELGGVEQELEDAQGGGLGNKPGTGNNIIIKNITSN